MCQFYIIMFSTMLSAFLSFTTAVLDFEQAEFSKFFHLCNGFNELSFGILDIIPDGSDNFCCIFYS